MNCTSHVVLACDHVPVEEEQPNMVDRKLLHKPLVLELMRLGRPYVPERPFCKRRWGTIREGKVLHSGALMLRIGEARP